MLCEEPVRLEYTQHGGLTCKSTGRTQRPARLQPACSARRPARRCMVCTRVACHKDTIREAQLVSEGPGRFDPDRRTKSQLLLSLSY